MHNLTSFLEYHARTTPDAPALVYQDQRISHGELYDRAVLLAGWIKARGIGVDDVVALVMKNSAAFVEIAFAVSHLGAVLLPINYRLAAAEIAYIHGHAGAELIFADEEFAHLVDGLDNRIPVGEAVQRDSRVLSSTDGPRPLVAPREPDDLYRLVYTSGTTDRPKGVMHSYANAYWKSVDHVMALGLSAEDRLLIAGPLYHVGAFDLPGMAVLWMGGMWHVLRDFTPEDALGAMEADCLNGVWFAPVMLNMSLADEARARFDLSSVRWVIGGGERTPESRIREFNTLFPNARYIDAYGLTESCSGDTFMEAGREIEKIGSVGRPLAHVRLQIRDDEGRVLLAGETGEICLAGARITKGYWCDPERTAAAFHTDGWFRTGDVGVIDADGFLYLTDRKKDMIISGGENIASSEVERVLYEMPEIAEAAVIGRPDPQWGERPVAVIVARPGMTVSEASLVAHCREHLAGFKVPKEVHVLTQLPRNPSGKVLKRVLREQLDGEEKVA